MVLVFEGLAYALAPSLLERILEALRAMPQEHLRWFGLSVCFIGIVLLYCVSLYFH